MERPRTLFAWNGDIALAYHVTGRDRPRLPAGVLLAGRHELGERAPRAVPGRALAARPPDLHRPARLGCSDRFSPSHVADIGELTDDLKVVMDAAGSERAAIMATSECGLIAMVFAASYTERTAALILVDAFATYSWTEETPWMETPEHWDEAAAWLQERWGTPTWTEIHSWPDRSDADWFERFMRASITPSALAAEIRRYVETDVRSVLPAIQAPTLLFADLDVRGESAPESGRFLASRIPGADSGTAPGERSSNVTTRPCGRSSVATKARRSTRPATASSPPSTGRAGPSAARLRSPKP